MALFNNLTCLPFINKMEQVGPVEIHFYSYAREGKGKGKGKVRPIRGHEGPEGD
jgi:hypothetical protein